uniref:Uncharacterized protein n=1 Tax=viral metagenome TaxID=1070528 RepID=A0A6C0I4F9_9ZZZZ
MEKRINKKFEQYITTFKDDIRSQILKIDAPDEMKELLGELVGFVYDYERFSLTKEDMTKRRRVKNAIPSNNRCSAKRANGEQCTRRRKKDCEFCGTHTKGTPHGLVLANDVNEEVTYKVETIAREICGIVYYIDKFNNVYRTEDILDGRENPRIIAKCEINNDVYSIKNFQF